MGFDAGPGSGRGAGHGHHDASPDPGGDEPQRKAELEATVAQKHARERERREVRATRAARERREAEAEAAYLAKMRPIWAEEARRNADVEIRAWNAATYSRIAGAAEREVDLDRQRLIQSQTYGR